jgi:putative membrane protein
LKSSGAQLNAGGKKLADGSAQVSAGLNQMDSQLQGVTISIPQVSQDQLNQLGQLKSGANRAAEASAGIYSGMKKYQGAMADPSETQVNQIVDRICSRSPQSCATPEAKKQLAAGVKAGMAEAATSMGDAGDPNSLLGKSGTANKGIQGYASQISGGVDQLTGLFAKAPEIQKQITALKDGVHQLATGAGQVSSGISAYTGGVSKYTAGAGTLADGVTAYTAGVDKYAAGAGQLAGGVSAYTGGVSKYTAGVGALSSGVTAYTAGVGKYAAGAGTLADGVSAYTAGVAQYTGGVHAMAQQMPQMTSGAQQYVSGVGQFAGGVQQLATGTEKLYGGQVKLSQGAAKYAAGTNTFATQVAKGATQVPTYSASDREKLADVVSAPVSSSSTPMGTSAWVVGLVLILGLWIGALAIWLVARTVPSRVLTSSKSTLSLLWSSLSTGTGVMVVSALGLALLGTATTGISALRGVGLFAMLLLAGAMFLVVNHALAAWLHAGGRFISAIFVAVAAAVGVVSAVPGPVHWINGISPLKPAMDSVTAILAGHSPELRLPAHHHPVAGGRGAGEPAGGQPGAAHQRRQGAGRGELNRCEPRAAPGLRLRSAWGCSWWISLPPRRPGALNGLDYGESGVISTRRWPGFGARHGHSLKISGEVTPTSTDISGDG